MSGVQSLIVPVLVILQKRVDQPQRNNQQAFASVDAQVLEEVRNDWCALVGAPGASRLRLARYLVS